MHLSVIIPTLNESRCLPSALASIPTAPPVEVIVVDGGSTDGTIDLARSACRLIRSPPGRWCQMNAGAAAATGEVLLFLHADSRLPPHAFDAVRSALRRPEVVGGAFRLRIDPERPGLRLVAWMVNVRSLLTRTPYGDQAIFVRRRIFRRIGGFAELPIMEDVDLVRRMRAGGRIMVLKVAVTTSARRWLANGVFRTTVTNWSAMLLYLAGIRTTRIRRFYDRILVKR